MTESQEGWENYPFKITQDEHFDPFGLTVSVEFNKSLGGKEIKAFEKVVSSWADKGYDEGDSEGKLDYLDEELAWGEGNKRAEFFVDLGSAGVGVIDKLFGDFTDLSYIKSVDLGYGHLKEPELE